MINKDRLINDFIHLTTFDSESFNEIEIQRYLIERLKELGLEVYEDNSKDYYKKYTHSQNTANNIYGYLKGTIPGKGIILTAHIDTVSPGINKKAILESNLIRSDLDTVLGADDLSAVASVLEALKVIKENNIPHKDIEVIFFVAEEPFAKGSRHFDYSLLKSDIAYVFDLEGNVNDVALEAPSIITFEVNIKGRASHAGFNPEGGVNALTILNQALNEIKLGRIDDSSTINIGLIHGGSGINIVPDLITLRGEVRSLDDNKALGLINIIKAIFTEKAYLSGGAIEFNYEVEFNAYHINSDEEVIKRYVNALSRINDKKINYHKTFGGSDNNNLRKNNINGVVIGNGMRKPHSKEEYILIDDLIDTANLVFNLIIE